MKIKVKRSRKQQKPRNVAAKALRDPLFRHRVAETPKGYRRKPKFVKPIALADPADE